jgi:hypothetical protein
LLIANPPGEAAADMRLVDWSGEKALVVFTEPVGLAEEAC